MKCKAINSKIFFLAAILFFEGAILDLNNYSFPWQMCFIWGLL